MPDQGPATRDVTSRRWLVVPAVAVAAYAVGLAVLGIRDALAALAAASALLLAGAVLLQAVRFALLALVHWASVLAVGHRIPYPAALNVSMAAFTLGQSVPGGGAVAGAMVVQRYTRLGLDGPVAAACIALFATLATSTIAAVGAGGITLAVLRGEVQGAWLAVALVVLVVLLGLVAGVLTAVRSHRLGQRILDVLERRSRRISERVDQWRSSLGGLADRPPGALPILRIVVASAATWSADIMALALVFAALGQEVTIMVVVVGFAVAQLGAAIPITPGGVGFVEGGMVAAFVALGVGLSAATVVVVVYRVLATWVPMLVGVPALLRPPRTRSRD